MAVALRLSYGLESDLEHVLRLAGDPAAVARGQPWGLPLAEYELAELERRAQTEPAVVGAANAFGERHPTDWAGVWIDQAAGGTVVAQFTARVAMHRAALLRLVNPMARIEVRQVRRTLAELDEIRDRIANDQAFFPSLGARYVGSGIDIASNVVRIDIETNVAGAEHLIRDHFKVGEALAVRIRPAPDVWTGPRGALVAIARTGDGFPVSDLQCMLIPDDPTAWGGDLRVTGDSDRCRFEGVGATGVDVVLQQHVAGGWVVVGRGRAVVLPDDVVEVTVAVSPIE